MVKLNLPGFEYRLKNADGKVWIFDVIRKKFLVLTPEEWVRQHFVHYIINELKYPRSLIKVEGGLSYNALNKRSDIVIFDRAGQPWMLVECKSPDVKLSATSIAQAAMYNSTLKATYLAVTNGLVHVCANINWADSTTEQLNNFPKFPTDS